MCPLPLLSGVWGPALPEALLEWYSICPPNSGHSGSFVWLLHYGSVTGGDDDRGVQDMGAPCRIKQAVPRAPVTGNLTQITSGGADCTWQVHPYPSDKMSLFCLVHLCQGIGIFGEKKKQQCPSLFIIIQNWICDLLIDFFFFYSKRKLSEGLVLFSRPSEALN